MANTSKAEILSPKQEAFCLYYAVENLSQRQAYIKAYGQGNKTDKSIDELASRLVKTVKVASRLEELKKTLTERALWSKADMINDLKDIASECKVAPVEVVKKGELSVKRIDSKARAVAVNAIKTAGEMLGYKVAESNMSVTINLEDVLKKAESKSDY